MPTKHLLRAAIVGSILVGFPGEARAQTPTLFAGGAVGGAHFWKEEGHGSVLFLAGATWRRASLVLNVADVTVLPGQSIPAEPGYHWTVSRYGTQCHSANGSTGDARLCGAGGDLRPQYGASAEVAYALPGRSRPFAIGGGWRKGFEAGGFGTVSWLTAPPDRHHWFFRAAVAERWISGTIGGVYAF